MNPIPDNLLQSQGLAYIVSKGWAWSDNNDGQVKVEYCPLCNHGNFHLYVCVTGNKDGLWYCHHCGKTGNLVTLKEALGDSIQGVQSRNEWAGKGKDQVDPLPDVASCHAALVGNPDAMDYLLNVRGFSQDIIEKQKLGLKEKVWFKSCGEVTALVIPYLVNGNIVFAKYRSLPPAEKDFSCPKGWDAPLYNGEILNEQCTEIVFVEGEPDCISCLSNGIKNVVGVPGANIHKAMWIEALDRIAPKIYILYDNDKVGIKASQELASRIGIDKCFKIVLPPFEIPLETGGTRPGKDINEWFRHGGGTLEKFEELKKSATLFDVTGVTSTADALSKLEDELESREDLAPRYVTKWKEINRLVGFEDGDVIDICAPEKVGKTTFGLDLVDDMVSTYDEPGLIVCLEMAPARLVRKWVSKVTGFSDDITEPGSPEAKAKLEELKEAVKQARAIQQERKADLYFAYPQAITSPDDVYKLVLDCILRYGVKWVMIDNLQLLCDMTLRNQNHRTIHLSQISKQTAKIAKDKLIKLIRILQPKRIDKGEIIGTNDVDGSSQVAKDCDCMITMWRAVVGELKKSQYAEEAEGFSEGHQSFEEKTRFTVGLTRYSAGGFTYLRCEGDKSRFTSYPEIEKRPKTNYNAVLMKEPEPNTVLPIEAPVNKSLPQENIPI